MGKQLAIQVKTKKKILPLIMAMGNKIIKELNLVEKIDTKVKWDSTRWNVSPGNLIKALILGTFTDMRAPLSHVGDRFIDVDMSYLFGENANENTINQYNIGEALERLGESECHELYQESVLEIIRKYNIPTERLHADTTSISFYGEYDVEDMKLTEEDKSELLCIERGYNKDGRPLCKQVVVGEIVNEDGIILSSQVMDGSTSDVEWNRLALKEYRKLTDAGMPGGLMVADSKLVTKDLVKELTDPASTIPFVSRCPSNFDNKLESRMIRKAYQPNEFKELGKIGNGKNASSYQGVSYIEDVHGKPLRLLVLQSSILEEKAEKSLEKARLALEPLLKEIMKKEFACEEDAKRECARLDSHSKARLFVCRHRIKKSTIEKWPRGRKTAKSKPHIEEIFSIEVDSVDYNEEAKKHFLQNESCFVLISNKMPEDMDDYALLAAYKGQQVVENSFRLLKEPSLASVIYLKKPERVEALAMVLTLALLIRAILQYKLRSGLEAHQKQNPDTVLKIGWNNKPLKNPTYKLIFEHTFGICFEREDEESYSFSFRDKQEEFKISTLLQLMNISLEELIE